LKKRKKYHVFISYSHLDKSYVSAIQKSIEKLGLPFYKSWRPNVSIFRDERKIPLAGSLKEKIIDGLRQSEHLIVIASESSANSKWVKEEILSWHQENRDDEGYIVNFNFILIDDVIKWDDLNQDFDKLKTTALPSFEKRIFKDLPIWANIQPYCKKGRVQSNNSNYQWEIAKIKGLLLDRKPDEIIDEVSKNKSLFTIISSIVIVILIITTSIAVNRTNYALEKEKIAKDHEEIAIQKSEEATKNAQLANKNELEAINNLNLYKKSVERIIQDSIQINTQRIRIELEAEAKRKINDSREFLKKYITDILHFKNEQLLYGKPEYEATIYYDFDQWNIRPDASVTLDNITKFLIDNPNTFAIIESYKQDDETEIKQFGFDIGLHVSIGRAQSVKKYLTLRDIDASRIKTYGLADYISSNAANPRIKESNYDESELQLKRKSEIKIYTKK
jgi:outer membrane protein OmpA-like peptidoglycan-associated protein